MLTQKEQANLVIHAAEEYITHLKRQNVPIAKDTRLAMLELQVNRFGAMQRQEERRIELGDQTHAKDTSL